MEDAVGAAHFLERAGDEFEVGGPGVVASGLERGDDHFRDESDGGFGTAGLARQFDDAGIQRGIAGRAADPRREHVDAASREVLVIEAGAAAWDGFFAHEVDDVACGSGFGKGGFCESGSEAPRPR
jgi:hypothetical protein